MSALTFEKSRSKRPLSNPLLEEVTIQVGPLLSGYCPIFSHNRSKVWLYLLFNDQHHFLR